MPSSVVCCTNFVCVVPYSWKLDVDNILHNFDICLDVKLKWDVYTLRRLFEVRTFFFRIYHVLFIYSFFYVLVYLCIFPFMHVLFFIYHQTLSTIHTN